MFFGFIMVNQYSVCVCTEGLSNQTYLLQVFQSVSQLVSQSISQTVNKNNHWMILWPTHNNHTLPVTQESVIGQHR